MSSYRSIILIAATCALSASARADLSLAAEDPPSDPPWKQPATISYVSNGDGSSSGTVDAVLRYKSAKTSKDEDAAFLSTLIYGVYWHRDTSSDAKRNDRGVEVSYGKLIFENSDAAGAVKSFSWKLKASAGRGIQQFQDTSGNQQEAERTKDRQIATIGGYIQPALSGTPPRPGSNDSSPAVWFFEGAVTLYSDHSSGGNGRGVGRLTGGQANVAANVAPLGLDPAFNTFGNFGFVPTLRISAQIQNDANATGDRKKETRKLFSAELSFAFGKLQPSDGVVPSLNIARTYGADVLTGRPKSGKTEVALGLQF